MSVNTALVKLKANCSEKLYHTNMIRHMRFLRNFPNVFRAARCHKL